MSIAEGRTVRRKSALAAAQVEEITALAKHYPHRRGASVEALKAVQRAQGWVSDAALAEVARLLGMSSDELDGVATFYNLIFRRPVGRHVILLCDSISCWIMGYEGLRERLAARLGVGLGETTADGRFTLLPTVCLGACEHAPVLMIGDDLHRDCASLSLDVVLDQYP
jgi:NADH-quinone oxidoreductase subunit E